MMTRRKWLRAIVAVIVLLAAANGGILRALHTSAARRYLSARLSASFGRPVDVGRFDFNLFDGARLEAHSVTVAEDPHFGNEYFLRADTLTAGLRWRVLLSGRFEFGSLSLLRPSLNLVRDAEGHWNVERWLPTAQVAASRPGFVGPLAAPSGSPVARLYRIDVDTGRINFKQLNDKSPFALTDVSGDVNQDSAGRWQLDLEALPMRAGVELQDMGVLRVRGTIAGTSARLQPAELNLSWRAASLADALRLIRDDDYGMRGVLSVDLIARVAPPVRNVVGGADSGGAQWSISGVARLTGIHGWKLPEHDTDPATNLSVKAAWRLGDTRAQILSFLIEMPNSHLQGTGDVGWGHGFEPQLNITSSALELADVLSWYRSLRPGVAADLRAQGSLGLDLALGGWPLQFQRGAISSSNVTLTATSLPAPLRIGPVNANVSNGGLDFAATEVSFQSVPKKNGTGSGSSADTSPSAFLLRGSIFPKKGEALHWPPSWNLSVEGATPRTQDWLVLSQELAQPLNVGWTASGGLAAKMRGTHQAESEATVWLGTMDSRQLTVSPAYVNQPLALPKAHLEFTSAQKTFTLTTVQAFGADWHGTIARKSAAKQWTFDLTADHLDAADLDRWLGPPARPGFLERIASFGSSPGSVAQTTTQAAVSDTSLTRIEARGRLRAGEIVMAPMRLEQFDGDVEISGRTIDIRQAQTNFFGGQASGSFGAQLLVDPSYEFRVRFDRVDLAQLAHAVPFLTNRVAGIASGALSLSAHGIGRRDLIASLNGDGTLNVRGAEMNGFDLAQIFPGSGQDTTLSPFDSLKGTFQIHDAGVDLVDLVLDHSRGRLQADGRIDFSHALNLRIRPSILEAADSSDSSSSSIPPPSFLLSGTIEVPKIAVLSSAPRPATATKSGRRGR